MDDEIVWQIVEHTYAISIWILKYIKTHNLPVADEASWPNFKFHMARLRALLQELDHPLAANPLLSDAILQGKPSDTDYTEPLRGCCCAFGTGFGSLLRVAKRDMPCVIQNAC